MARRELRLQAELLDRAVVPGIDFYVRLAVDAVGGDDEAESVSVSAITCEWHGTERLDPAWVRPARGKSSASTSSGGGELAPGERFFAKSPAAKVAADVVARAGDTLAFRVGLCLPPGMPPSFRGAVARYAYAVTFVATTGGDRVVHRMPLPVETVSGVADGGAEAGGWGLAEGDSGGFLGAAPSPSSSRDGPDAGSPTGRPAVVAGAFSSPTHPAVAGRLARSDSLPPPESPGSPLAALGIGFAGGADSPASASSPFGRADGGGWAASPPAPPAAYAIALDDGSRLLRVIPRAPTPRCVAGGAFEVALDFGTEDEPSAGAADRRGGDGGGGDDGGGGGDGGSDGGDGQFRCERVSVSLETEEVVVAGAVYDVGPGSTPNKSLADRERDGECVVTRKVWCERSEWTLETRETHLCLASPTDAPASFRTSRAQLRWIARFEFTASAERGGGRRAERKVEWRMPVEMSGAHASGLGARGTARGVPAGWDGARASMTRESSLLAM